MSCAETKEHRMPTHCLKKHEKYCHLRNKGYKDSEIVSRVRIINDQFI